MFVNVSGLKQTALEVIEKLSFDIISVVVAAHKVVGYFEETMHEIERGSTVVKDKFVGLCNSFLALNDSVSQEYLNGINKSFKELLDVLNESIFPDISSKMAAIQQSFKTVNFQTSRFRLLFKNAM